jgi:hypothetical protein
MRRHGLLAGKLAFAAASCSFKVNGFTEFPLPRPPAPAPAPARLAPVGTTSSRLPSPVHPLGSVQAHAVQVQAGVYGLMCTGGVRVGVQAFTARSVSLLTKKSKVGLRLSNFQPVGFAPPLGARTQRPARWTHARMGVPAMVPYRTLFPSVVAVSPSMSTVSAFGQCRM